jgi:hypothetical protein
VWYGWVHVGGEWKYVGEHDTQTGCAKMIHRQYPTVPSIRRALTGGHVPGWVPGRFSWETVAPPIANDGRTA